jgi:hypothetical protein
VKQFSGTEDEPQHQDWRWGAGANFEAELENFVVAADFGVTNATYSSSELVYDVADRSGGLGANARIGIGDENVSVWMQYVSALETIGIRNEETGTTDPSVPAAFAVELNAGRDFQDFAAFFAASYSRTWDLETILPQEQVMVTAGIQADRLRMLVEYGHQWDYASSGGTGRATAHFVTLKAVIGY